MAEITHEPKHVRQPEERQKRQASSAVIVIGFIFMLGLGYLVGAYNTQIIARIAPLFGINAYSGTLDVSSLQSTYQALKANFAGTIDDATLIEGANRGMVESLGDEYTVFFNKTEANDFNNDLNGTIGGGIGVELGLRDGRVTAIRVLADNPAAKAGILAGDVFTKINDEAITDAPKLSEVVQKVRGEVGTTVKITVARGAEEKEFTVTRAEVTNPSVYSTVTDGVGVMTITRFDEQTGQLAREAAQSFKNQNVKSVVLDLRGNGGGYLIAAQDVAGIWLNDKVVVSERNNGKVVDELKSGTNPILGGIPTVVLVNASSASASEIVAGALQDHGAAKLVGQTTFGKGSVQKLIGLPDGAQLKVTIARWYTPNGKNISKQGITVDKEVSISTEDINANRDPQLDAAKALLQ